MLQLAADDNFNSNIVRGLLRRNPQLDILRLQDAGLAGAEDPVVLEWAADQNRILLTHDVSTMTRYVYERIKAGLPTSGVVEVPQHLPVARAIDDLLILALYSLEDEWHGQILYLPLG